MMSQIFETNELQKNHHIYSLLPSEPDPVFDALCKAENSLRATMGLVLLEEIRSRSAEIRNSELKLGGYFPPPPLPVAAYERAGGWDAFWIKVRELGGKKSIIEKYDLMYVMNNLMEKSPHLWKELYNGYNKDDKPMREFWTNFNQWFDLMHATV